MSGWVDAVWEWDMFAQAILSTVLVETAGRAMKFAILWDISRSIRPVTGPTMGRSMGDPMGHATGHPMRRPTGNHVDPIGHPTGHVGMPVGRSMRCPVKYPISNPASRPMGRPVGDLSSCWPTHRMFHVGKFVASWKSHAMPHGTAHGKVCCLWSMPYAFAG